MNPTRSRALAGALALCLSSFARGGDDPKQEIARLIQSGQTQQARAALLTSLKTLPDDPELWNMLGIVSVQQNDRPGAARSFRKAVRLAPRFEGAWLNLGRLYLTSPDDRESIDKGIATYDTVLRLNPASAEAHHQMAVLLEWKGDFAASLAHLDSLPPEDRDRRPALALRCADQAALGHAAEALEAAARLLRDPDLDEEDVIAVLPPIEAHDSTVALKLLEGLAGRNAADKTLPQLAALYEARGDLGRAREAYERAAQRPPASAKALLDLARVAWKQKDFEGTLGYLAHARELEPGNASVHFFFGLASNELRLPVEAKKSLTRALELDPENPYYNYAMGAILLQATDTSQAIPYLRKFVDSRPQDARGRLALATAYFTAYRPDEAKPEIAIAAKDPVTRPGAEYLAGRIARQEGDAEGAITHFRRVIGMEPKSPEVHAELAAALLDKQDEAGARAEAETALKLDADNYLANRTLLTLYQLANDPRAAEQTTRLEKLIEKRDAQMKLLLRTVEVRPW